MPQSRAGASGGQRGPLQGSWEGLSPFLEAPPTESQEPWFPSPTTFTETMKDRRLGSGDLPEVCYLLAA